MERYPLDIRFWALFDTSRVPHYRVFECMGPFTIFDRNEYLFMERGTINFIIKSVEELEAEGYRPFLMDMPKILKRKEEMA